MVEGIPRRNGSQHPQGAQGVRESHTGESHTKGKNEKQKKERPKKT